jgi:hypothetical protein
MFVYVIIKIIKFVFLIITFAYVYLMLKNAKIKTIQNIIVHVTNKMINKLYVN